jgi:putative membrane protein
MPRIPQTPRNTRFAAVLGVVYVVVSIPFAFNVEDRLVWFLENILAYTLVILLVITHRAFPLSRISYTAIFVFLLLHTVAAHYSYSKVPYDDWFAALTGRTFNSLFGWERNHYDRMVHFMYGLLFAYPMRELFLRVASARGFWGYFLPLDVTISTSAIYELIEWGTAVTLGDGAPTYLGTQGDEWDAHKDMLLASTGALIAMVIVVIVNLCWQRDFAREFIESLRVKDGRPLDEGATSATAKR